MRVVLVVLRATAMIDLAGQPVAQGLEDDYQDDAQHDGEQHHIGHESLVAITNRHIAQTARTDGTRHSGIAEQVDEGDSQAADE